MSLAQELIKPILEADKRTVAVYGGGFKPPTKGHFEVVAQAIKKNPNIDKFVILIGGKERDGVTPEDSLLIWDIYKQYLPINVEVELSSKPPIQAVYNYEKDHPNEDVIFVIGAREGNEDDFADIAKRTKSVDNYPNLRVSAIVTQGGASGTAARNAAKTDISKLKPLLPNELKDNEVEEIFNLISDSITEGRKKKKDPKKGTGKKPEGSSRRLYTDEDPKDTVGVKFSSRQDIVDTFSKKSFKAKSHARQSQIINLVHQRVRAAYNRAKDPAVKKRLKTALNYAEKRKEASKRKTQRLKKQKLNEKLCKRGKAYIAKRKREGEKHNPFLAGRAVKVCKGQIKGSDGKKKKDFRPKKGKTRSAQGRKPDIVKEKKGFGKSAGYRYRAIYKKGDKYYYMQDNPFSPGIRQEFGPFKTREAAKRKMQSFPPGTSYRDIKEIGIDLSNYSGQILPGDVLRAPKGFPLGGKKLEKSLQLKVIKNSREGVNRYKLSLEDKDGKKYTVRNFQMDGEYKGKKLPKWGLVRKSKKNINENATYSNKIDYKKLIKDFTKHMIKIGKNIQPLPRVIFKHSDSDNASNFFGRTAYYDPNNQTIVLYTEGRHPKDIVRSFAHEMVHHTQYLEDRLGNVQTTNTNADANLDRIEREAYLDGNMVFRNWTDSIDGDIVTSINEKKNKTKDPFGLNAFAYELAMLREDNKDYYIYLDMDGVVANFDKRFEDLSGMTPSEFISKYDKNAFWDLIDEKHKIAFWRGIEVMPGADRLVNYVAQYPYEMLTAPSAKKQSVIGKSLWIKDKVGTLYSSQPKVTYKRAKEKHLVKPNLTKFDILIDDKPSTIDNWNNAGGTGIFYQSASQVINDLKKLGL